MTRLARLWSTALLTGFVASGCGQTNEAAPLKELQKTRVGNVDVVLLSQADALPQGKGSFVLEFRSSSDGQLIDVGTIRVNATMPMAGMPPMFGSVSATQSQPGRYMVQSDLNMAGTWQFNVTWEGPQGSGDTTLRSPVR